MASGRWANRIVGYGEEAPDQLLANPRNYRIHPHFQERALQSVLEDVGWVQSVIVNVRTGCVVDGHLRVAMAISQDEESVPITYVDLSPEEERKILVTFDPIGSMAVNDQELLAQNLQDMELSDANLMTYLQNIAHLPGDHFGTMPPTYYWVTIGELKFPITEAEYTLWVEELEMEAEEMDVKPIEIIAERLGLKSTDLYDS